MEGESNTQKMRLKKSDPWYGTVVGHRPLTHLLSSQVQLFWLKPFSSNTVKMWSPQPLPVDPLANGSGGQLGPMAPGQVALLGAAICPNAIKYLSVLKHLLKLAGQQIC